MVTDSRGDGSRLVLPVLAYGVLLVAALQIMVVPIVRDIGVSLGASTSAVSWVVRANLLAAAVFTPLLGSLGDLRGRRPVLLGVLVYQSSLSRVIGRSRIRLPVAWYTTLAIAAATPTRVTSPRPFASGGLALSSSPSRNTASIAGMSAFTRPAS